MPLIRIRLTLLASLTILSPSIANAQSESVAPDGTTTIDIRVDPQARFGPEPPMEDCSDEQEAAILSGEIIVCRRKQDQRKYRTLPEDAALKRYARETMYANDPQAPDVAGAGIFRGPATIGGMCLIPPCPPPPALIIDVEALPEAPPGSDADRVGRGLVPLGREEASEEDIAARRRELLGLPEPEPQPFSGVTSDDDAEVSPAAEEEPGAQP